MYVKLFASIYQGTLRGHSHCLLVFTNLLAHCDKEGVADIHPRAISEEVGLSIGQVRSALDELEKPDSESRSPEEDGRRIVRLDEHRAWGWQIVNYVKYRAIRSEDDRREQNRTSQAAYRKRSKQSKPPSAQAEAEGEEERDTPPPPSVVTPLKPKVSKRCPPEFLVTRELQQWARTSAPLVDIRAETATFRDYEFAKGASDWPARWRVWMAKEQKRLAEVSKRGGISTVQAMQVEKHQHQKQWTEGIFGTKQTAGPALPTQSMEILDGLVRNVDA